MIRLQRRVYKRLRGSEWKTQKAGVGPGCPDGDIQRAFERLVRMDMGIGRKDKWPKYPSVAESSPEWPLEARVLEDDDPEAVIDPLLRAELPLGRPLLRIHWERGRIDDAKHAQLLGDLASELVDYADDHNLPDEPDKRQFTHVRDACKRTLWNIRREARLCWTMDVEARKAGKQQKLSNDRRRGRHSTRVESRRNVVGKDTVAKAILEVVECVERDLSEFEDGDDELANDDAASDESGDLGPKTLRTLRAVIPEWWSAQNKGLQARLDRIVPNPLGAYTVKPALQLELDDRPLSPGIFRAANPKLVRNVLKNLQPYKPQRYGIANHAEEWVSPILELGESGQANEPSGMGGSDGTRGSGGAAELTGGVSGTGGIEGMVGEGGPREAGGSTPMEGVGNAGESSELGRSDGSAASG